MPPQSLAADLSLLPVGTLTDHALTSHLASRYHQGLPFANVSTTTLVAFNTFQPFDRNQDQTFQDFAARVYNRLYKRGESQVVLFLGESGSGKTEFCNSLTGHLLTLSNNPLSTKVKHASNVFAAFTTTKTASSLMASRAGSVLELQYGSDATLIGASVLDYRLERARVTKVPTAERNYHVFYYLVSGTAESEREHLALTEVSSSRYRYLGHHTQLRVGLDDRTQFKHLKASLKALEFSRADIANICQILAAILHIGQLTFRSTGADGTSSAAIEVANTDTLSCIASFLGVRASILESSLSYKTVNIGNDRVTLVLDQKGARENADELARALYSLLFKWILEKINTRLSQARATAWTEELETLVDNTITVVDFPGFSISSAVPTLDKLLHNSANEVLYNYLLKCYYEKPVERFGAEEVVVPMSEYFDNTDTVKALFKPAQGLLNVLDDYSRRDKNDSAFVESLRRRFETNSSSVLVDRHSFSIRHFAGEVEYATDGLVASNTEAISGDIISLFTSSSSSDFLKSVFASSAVVDSTFGAQATVVQAHLSSKPQRAPSLIRKGQRNVESNGSANSSSAGASGSKTRKSDAAGQFVSAISNLVDSFEGANPYFVLCLKPNDHRLSSSFDARCVRQQIKALGLPEIARQTKQMDCSLFLTFNEFLNVVNFEEGNEGMLINGASSERDQAIGFIQARGLSDRDARYGLTGVFLSETAWLQLTDPKQSFAEYANQRFLEADGGSGSYDNDGYYYDAETKSLGGATIGNMFKFNDSRSVNKDQYIHTKEVGEAEDDNVDELSVSGERRRWMFIVWLWTWWVPDFFIKTIGRMPRKDVRVAWREKLAINMMIWFVCVGSVVFLVGFPILICPLQDVMSPGELSGFAQTVNPQTGEANTKVYTAIGGVVFDLFKFAPSHYPKIVSTDSILRYGGKDASGLFPVQPSAVCTYTNGSALSDFIVYGTAGNYSDPNTVYHDFRAFTNDSRPDWFLSQMQLFNQHYRKGYIGYTPTDIQKLVDDKSRSVVSYNGFVYDFTNYTSGQVSLMAPPGQSVPDGLDPQFMDENVMNLVRQFTGSDITKAVKTLNYDESEIFRVERCMKNLFMIGKLDTRDSVRCKFARYFLLAITIFVVAIIAFKFIAALQFQRNRRPDDLDKFFICQVPAYTEDEEELRRAIDSLARLKYDDKRKLLMIICDGMIVGAGNDRPTPRIVLDILGVPGDVDPEALSFESLGEGNKQHNMGKIYSGLYEVQGHIVPFVVIVKVGKPTEINRPGNRGKRDSQLLLMRFLNRVHYNLPMNPLELELYHQIQNVIGVNPAFYEFLLQVDADTQVAPDSASQLIAQMVHDQKLQAVCGETELSNARSSIVTMMQVYEYYISHNLAKAFESLFGSVTCLPGCFSLFRIYEPGSGKPLFVSHAIVTGYSENRVDTLHVKNLLHLGEDRFLTTLLLKHNVRFKTKFWRFAKASTVAPGTWSVFLSQRRRWINSTVHNLVELAPMGQLCGFCCFSMRFVVMVDLFSTIVQPVTIAYLVYLFYLIGTNPTTVPITSIVMLGAIYGLQALVFLVRRRWEMIGWMLVYILALPIFSLALPLYSFWHMDDFSWGSTRVVLGEKGKKLVLSSEGKFDPSEIPMQRWQEYQTAAWQHDDVSVAPAQSQLVSEYDAASRPMSQRPMSQMSMRPVSEMRVGGGPSRTATMTGASINQNDVEMTNLRPQSVASMGNLMIPSDEQLTTEIREILRTADLMTVTKKSIRLSLERKFGVKLGSKRDYINFVTESILTGEL